MQATTAKWTTSVSRTVFKIFSFSTLKGCASCPWVRYLSRYSRLGSGAFETVVAVLLLIRKTARLGAGLTVVWMTAEILSHIFVLGYGWFFVDALMVMVLGVIYLLLTGSQSHSGELEGWL